MGAGSFACFSSLNSQYQGQLLACDGPSMNERMNE